MQGWLERLHAAALNRAGMCIVLWGVAFLGALLPLPWIQIDASFRAFFDDEDPYVIRLDELRENYVTGDYSIFVVVPKEGDVYAPRSLQAIEALTEAAWKLPGSLRVDSLTNLPRSGSADDMLSVRDMIEDAASLTSSDIVGIRTYLDDHPLLAERLVSGDRKATLVVVTFPPQTGESVEASREIHANCEALRAELRNAYPDIDFYISGVVAGNAGVTKAATRDGMVIIPLGLGIALLLMYLFLRQESGNASVARRGLFASVAVIAVSSVIPMGAMSVIGIAANNVTTVVPVIILTLAVADSLHILINFNQRLCHGDDAVAAMRESLRINAEPVWITSATTVIGFAALNFSESPPFRHMGNLVAFGVVIAWFGANTLLPALMVLRPLKGGHVVERHLSLAPMARWLVRHPGKIVLSGLMVFAVGAYAASFNRINESWMNYLSDKTDFGADLVPILRHFENLSEIEFDLTANGPDGIYEPEYLQRVHEFSNWLQAQPEVRFVHSFDQTLMHLMRVTHGDDPDWFQLPKTREDAAQYMLLYEMSLPYGASTSSEVRLDRSASRLILGLRNNEAVYQLALQDRIQQWLSERGLQSWGPGTDTTVIMSNLAVRDAREMAEASILALLGIAVLIGIIFGSMRLGLLSVLVNTMPATVALGIWGLTVQNVGLSVSIVFSASIGIIVDYCIHFMSKFLRARRELNMDTRQAVEYSFGTVGVALLVTTAVLVINFAILSLSLFRVNIYMGLLTSMTISLALLTQLFFLPALLIVLDRRQLRVYQNEQASRGSSEGFGPDALQDAASE